MKVVTFQINMKLVALMIVAVLFQMASVSEGLSNEASNIDILPILRKILQRLNVMDTNYKDLKTAVLSNKDMLFNLDRNYKDLKTAVLSNKDMLFNLDRNYKNLKTAVLSNKDMLFNLDRNYKDLKTTVLSNKDMLFNLDVHVRGIHMKVEEVAHKTEVEQKEITSNKKSVKELAHRNEQLSELISVSLHNVSEDVHTIKEVLTEVLPGKEQANPAGSCSWIKKRSYCVRSGNYWIQHGGKSSLEYCKMDDFTPVTTPVMPTTAITTQPPVPRNATSCKDLKKQHPDLKSGMYNITIGIDTFEVVCDMETDNGGWTMVGKAVVNKESEAKEFDYTKIQHDDFHHLHKVTTGRFLLSTKGLNSLYDIHKFTELRFQCFKPYHGRNLDAKTKGSEVLEWLLERRSLFPKPPSCGTFTPLHNDQSFLGQHCEKWCEGKWRNNLIYDHPMGAYDGRLEYYVSLNYYNNHLYCDDGPSHPNFNNKGNWTFYIR